MEKQVVLVLLNNSLGEIHFILPYLKKLHAASGTRIYFYFINAKIYNKAIDDPFYYDQIVAHATILKPNDLLSFLFRERANVSLILKDTTPLTEKNIVFKIKKLCQHARLVLFPHAYALLGYKDEAITTGTTASVEDEHVDQVLYVHAYDMPTLAQRYAKEKLLFAGALGYTPWWSSEVEHYVKANRQKLKLSVPDNRRVVLFTLRDVHKLYLSDENYDYLFKSALEVLFGSTDFFMLIKPHPRQNIDKVNQFLSGYDSSRYTISYYNTFLLSRFSDLNLSFWSSAVTDCLAMGIPSIEFHRFHTPFGQTIQGNEGLQSFYSFLRLTTAVHSREDLQQVMPADQAGIDDLYQQQRTALDKIFANAEQGFDNFAALAMPGKKQVDFSMLERANAFIYFGLKYIFRKFKPV